MVLSFIPKFEGKFDQLKNIGSANTGPSYLSETAPFFSSNYDHILKKLPSVQTSHGRLENGSF